MQKSTLKKLSQTLGLSISTVSRALKDHPDISESTRKKVKELATAMEYEPNSYAVQLRTRKSNVIGVLIPTIKNFFTIHLSPAWKKKQGGMAIRC